MVTNTQKLALAATLVFSIGCAPAMADCGMLTFWTQECQQEKQRAALERKSKIDEICIKMGFQPKTPRFMECYDYINYHFNRK